MGSGRRKKLAKLGADKVWATDIVQGAADELRRATAASFTVTIALVGDDLLIGAQCPDRDTLREMLRGALAGLDNPDAKVIDLQEGDFP